MATVLYARVSTSEQTIEHQRTQAEKAGFKLDQVIWDEGVSGVSTKLAERPQGRRLFDLLRNGDTLVVRARNPQRFFKDLAGLVLEEDFEIRHLETLDDSAHAILGYLLGGSGKT